MTAEQCECCSCWALQDCILLHCNKLIVSRCEMPHISQTLEAKPELLQVHNLLQHNELENSLQHNADKVWNAMKDGQQEAIAKKSGLQDQIAKFEEAYADLSNSVTAPLAANGQH